MSKFETGDKMNKQRPIQTQDDQSIDICSKPSAVRSVGPITNSDFEPLGGQPPQGAVCTIEDFDYQLKYQRAFELVLWAMPAMAIYRFRAGFSDYLGMNDCDILAWSGNAPPNLEATTANGSTPYITAYCDLRSGPLVLEMPEAGPDGSVYGQVVDAWQLSIADVGPSGMDAGKGGKYLFTPPDFECQVPDGYFHVSSPNYRIGFAFRSIRAEGKTPADAYAYSKRLRMYRLSQAENPPEQVFFDPMNVRYPTLPFYDETHFEDMHAVFSVEPVRPEDKVMMGYLETLGIRHGQPFEPDETARRAMRQATIDAWFFMQNWFDNFPKDKLYWPDRHFGPLLMCDDNRTFTWIYENRIDTLTRAAEYFWCTYMPRVLSDSPATQYLMAVADADGNLMEAGKTYKIDIPANFPVKQFWAITVYDHATMTFIYTKSMRTTLSSYDIDHMVKNDDGGVTIYIGPKAPEGLESNWISTGGKRPLPTVRVFGPEKSFNDKTFKLNDFELVDL